MIFNDRLDAGVALVFKAVALLVVVVSMREWVLILQRRKPAVLREAPFVRSGWGWRGLSVCLHWSMRPLQHLRSMRGRWSGWSGGCCARAGKHQFG